MWDQSVDVGKVFSWLKMNVNKTIPKEENFFQWFDVPEQFTQDLNQIKQTYFQLQLIYHPDQSQHVNDRAKAEVQDISARLNQAYQTLMDPLKRIEYLLSLNNSMNPESESFTNLNFLELQMDWQEQLQTLKSQCPKDWAHIDLFGNKISAEIKARLTFIQQHLDEKPVQNIQDVQAAFKELQFLKKLQIQTHALQRLGTS